MENIEQPPQIFVPTLHERKIKRAKELILNRVTYRQIYEILASEFDGTSLSANDLTAISKELKPQLEKTGITPEQKMDLKDVIDLFKQACEIDAFLTLVSDKTSQAITQLEKMI